MLNTNIPPPAIERSTTPQSASFRGRGQLKSSSTSTGVSDEFSALPPLPSDTDGTEGFQAVNDVNDTPPRRP